MRRASAATCGALVLALGCGRLSPPTHIQTATVAFCGYDFVYEYPEGTDWKTEGSREDDGKGNIKEDITVTCGTQVFRIINGHMKVNGADRGTVKQGDKIKFSSAGKVWVNEQPRGD